MDKKVEVVEHNPEWGKMYKEESKKIKAILGKNCVMIQHVGSTFAKGRKARPIIDIMVIAKDVSLVAEHNEELKALGYECKSHTLYVKETGTPAFYIYIYADSNKKETGKYLAVREYLRAHEDVAKEYEELRVRLAEEFPYDAEEYCNGKEAFLKEVEKKAVSWGEKEMQRSNYISMGMCLGLCIGTAIGTSMGNIAVGTSLGLSIGVAIGIIIGNQKVKG